jgi:hypothetical protein
MFDPKWQFGLIRPFRLGVAALAVGLLISTAGLQTDRSYWLATTASGTRSVLFAAPLLAAWCAFFGGRTRLSRLAKVERMQARSKPTVALATLAPATIVAMVSLLLIVGSSAGSVSGSPHLDSLGLLFLASLVIFAHSTFGYSLGRWLPRIIALPASAALSYLWLAFPRAFEPFWIRNITGEVGSRCCDISTTLGKGAILGPVVFNISVLVACFLAICTNNLIKVAPLCILIVAFGTLGGRGATKDLGPDPTKYRTSGLVCDEKSTIKFCWWREHAQFVDAARAPLMKGAENLIDAGFPRPSAISEAGSDPDVWNVGLTGDQVVQGQVLADAELARITAGCVSLNADQTATLDLIGLYARRVLDGEEDLSANPEDEVRLQAFAQMSQGERRVALAQLEGVVRACAK